MTADVALVDSEADPQGDERIVYRAIGGFDTENELQEILTKMLPRYRWLYYKIKDQ